MTDARTIGLCTNCGTKTVLNLKDYASATHWRCERCRRIFSFLDSITIPLEHPDPGAGAIAESLKETIAMQQRLIEQLVNIYPPQPVLLTQPTDFARLHSAEYQRLCQDFVQARFTVRHPANLSLEYIRAIDNDYQMAAYKLAEFVVGKDKAE